MKPSNDANAARFCGDDDGWLFDRRFIVGLMSN